MRSRSYFATFLLFSSIFVSAAPTGGDLQERVIDEVFCLINTVIIIALHKDPVATPFCSNYLGIQTKTLSVQFKPHNLNLLLAYYSSTSTTAKTPSSVYETIPVTITAPEATTTVTNTITTTTDVTTTKTVIETESETTTIITSTTVLTCLDSAFTATPVAPAVGARHIDKRLPTPSALLGQLANTFISKACSCLSIPIPSTTTTLTKTLSTGTITTTTTNTVTPIVTLTETATDTSIRTITSTTSSTTTTTITECAVATSITPNGIAFRKWTHTFDADQSAPTAFTSSEFKRAADLSGITQRLTFRSAGTPPVLNIGGNIFPATYVGILFQGFFIAKETGVHTFSSGANQVDNWSYFWYGDPAYGTWNDGNAAYKASRVTPPPFIGGSTSLFLNKGDAIPIAFLYANGAGPGISDFRVTVTGGSSTTDTIGFLVRACSPGTFT